QKEPAAHSRLESPGKRQGFKQPLWKQQVRPFCSPGSGQVFVRLATCRPLPPRGCRLSVCFPVYHLFAHLWNKLRSTLGLFHLPRSILSSAERLLPLLQCLETLSTFKIYQFISPVKV